VLIYNMLHNSVFKSGDTLAKKSTETMVVDDTAKYYEMRAQGQLQLAVVIFLLSWTPYVAESIFSSYIQISPIVGIISACIPVFSTSLLPVLFMESLRDEAPPKAWEGVVIMQ